jgi:contactin associated protein-like 2
MYYPLFVFVGAAVDYRQGFVGCMRGVRVNGQMMDMRGMLIRGEVTYGVTEGCVGKCASNPCFNGGTCREGYAGYTCDCSYTPMRGWMCGRGEYRLKSILKYINIICP